MSSVSLVLICDCVVCCVVVLSVVTDDTVFCSSVGDARVSVSLLLSVCVQEVLCFVSRLCCIGFCIEFISTWACLVVFFFFLLMCLYVSFCVCFS